MCCHEAHEAHEAPTIGRRIAKRTEQIERNYRIECVSPIEAIYFTSILYCEIGKNQIRIFYRNN